MKTRKSALLSFIVFNYYLAINKIFDGAQMQGMFFLLTVLSGMFISVKLDSFTLLTLSIIYPIASSIWSEKIIHKHSYFLYLNQK